MEWRTIAAFPCYEVSDAGLVRHKDRKVVLKPFTDRLQEYDRVTLYNGGRKSKVMVHILVAEAFLGPRPEGMEIDHLNTNRHDNRVCNLRYVTPETNRLNPITLWKREMRKRGMPVLF